MRQRVARSISGEGPAVTVVVEAEGEESPQVDGGGSVGEPELVSVDAAVAKAPVVVGHQPGQGAFDHRPQSAVAVREVGICGGGAGSSELSVVVVDVEGPARLGGGAAGAEGAAGAQLAEGSFWDGWIDARNHDWLYYEGIDKEDWPRHARAVAACLRSGRTPEDSTLRKHFDRPPRKPILERAAGMLLRRAPDREANKDRPHLPVHHYRRPELERVERPSAPAPTAGRRRCRPRGS